MSIRAALAVLLFPLLACTHVHAQEGDDAKPFSIQVEGAAVWQSRNDVRIPASTGTLFSLSELASGPSAAFRVYAGYRLAERHELRALYAPFSVEVAGRLPNAVSFQEQTFNAGQEVVGTYKFNSYRLTYRYGLVRDEGFTLDLGFTAKIRDAEIGLSQSGTSRSRTDVGFVPLIHLSATYELSESWSALFDFDGLWSPYGRAEDLALFAAYQASDDWQILGGYRMVEGGSDGSRGEVYTFAWLHSATLGARVRF